MIWTRLRSALALADDVAELRAEVAEIQGQWTEVLDKLMAREERMRKRYKSELGRAIEADVPDKAQLAKPDKVALRQRAEEQGLIRRAT